jgi:GTPase
VKFIDETVITVESGNGGRGCVSFRREAHVPRGGPDGGDGGRGGSVILSATSRHNSLYPFRFKRHFKAKNGGHGSGKQKTGKNGEDVIIEIPPGTLVLDADTGTLLKDFDKTGEAFTVANGGIGGLGNRRFKSSTHRAPRFAQPGTPGEAITLKLELKLIADVGIIGLPNAGKSTLIQAVSSAHPKIGDYPFTTLVPNLGVVETKWGHPFVMADIPGLIEGAHKGAGLGIRFLRHIERTRILIHLVDGAAIDCMDPLSAYHTINRELSGYNPALEKKPQIVVINKQDLPGVDQTIACFMEAAKETPVFCISALTGQGVQDVLSEIRTLLDDLFQRDLSDAT